MPKELNPAALEVLEMVRRSVANEYPTTFSVPHMRAMLKLMEQGAIALAESVVYRIVQNCDGWWTLFGYVSQMTAIASGRTVQEVIALLPEEHRT